MEYPIPFVCILGVAIVFIGLVCIILLCKILSAVCNIGTHPKADVAPVAAASVPTVEKQIPNRKKIVVAISAAIAEELGTDVSAIKIVSLKKL